METGIQITTSGRRYLGSALGTTQFKTAFTETKIREWTEQVNNLTTIANTKPQPAYSAFNHGITSQWTYFTRVTQCKKEELQPIEDSVRLKLIPSILDRPAPTDLERQMFALPIRLGGLGIRNPTNIDNIQQNSLKITKPLVDAITTNHIDMTEVSTLQRAIKVIITKETRSAEVEEAKTIKNKLPEKSKKSMEIASEKGTSNWLSALPIAEYGFSLHKSAFRDAICMRYGWQPRNLPTHCICGKNYTIEHYLSCPTGGFPTIRHNELRDTLAVFLKEVSHDVKIEPGLQELTGETFPLKTTSTDDMARLDISARGFFGSKYQQTFFDVRVCNPLAATYRSSSLDTVYRKHEAMKRRKYERRVREIEHSSFIPFVMSCAGGSGPAATIVIKRLASLMSESQNTSYSKTMGWLRCKLNYCMLRSSLMCLRGNRCLRQNTHNVNIETAVAETNITI